jgi:hypothetical protein
MAELRRSPFDVARIDAPIEDEIAKLATAAGAEAYRKRPKTPEALVEDRNATHGDFRTNARLSQRLKAVFRSYDGWEALDDVEKEVLDMVSLKISRILSGKSLERQHWEDIEGYAHLALKECK